MEISQYIIKESTSVLQAMKKLDAKGTGGTLFITDDDGRLLAALTDGDIRRFIINNGNLSETVEKVANHDPKYLYADQLDKAKEYLIEKRIDDIPILDDNRRIINIVSLNPNGERVDSNALADVPTVIMAGGRGTRLSPYTHILPKALIPVAEVPITEHIMNEFYRYGSKRFIMILNHKKNMIKAYYSDRKLPYAVEYVDENMPLGTGGGLSLLRGNIDRTFILTNCDILIKCDFSKVYREHVKSNNSITVICSTKEFTIPYGVVELDDQGGISNFKEKPSLSFLTNTGCYVVEPDVIDMISQEEKIDFPDIIRRCKSNNMKVGIYPISEDTWYDMGQLDELKRMETALLG